MTDQDQIPFVSWADESHIKLAEMLESVIFLVQHSKYDLSLSVAITKVNTFRDFPWIFLSKPQIRRAF